MRSAMVTSLLVLALAGIAGAGDPGEIERLRAENARLAARVAALEAENADLKVLAGVAPAPGAEEQAAARVATRFDQEREVTRVTSRPTRLEVLEGVRGRHWMTLEYEHAGQTPGVPVDTVRLEMEAASVRAAYQGARTLRLSIDGVSEECGVVGYRTMPVTVGSGQRQVGAREVVVVAVPRATLARVAGAREVRGEIGPTRFRLTPEQIVEFRVFQRRLGG